MGSNFIQIFFKYFTDFLEQYKPHGIADYGPLLALHFKIYNYFIIGTMYDVPEF